jgi:7,8-dihydropterin-6-yl-methyl-4-(beta-D-ribofuranosyl)aminobenzene 5'-phosphate synthase
MKLTVLTENFAGGQFQAEHGLSYFIEHDGKKTLFDTGHSDVFLKNAQKLGVDIQREVHTIVLSHGHWDHGDGLRYVSDKTLITHPSAFIQRYRKKDYTYIGLELKRQDLEEKFNLVTTQKPYKISKHIIFLGEVPRLNTYEAKTTPFIDENGNPDFVPDDSALAIIHNYKLIIVTGCSHAGICNIIEYAMQVSGINHVEAVIGGFHLKHNNQQTEDTIHYFKNQRIETIYPSHCTELPALAEFYCKFGIQQLKTGMILEL